MPSPDAQIRTLLARGRLLLEQGDREKLNEILDEVDRSLAELIEGSQAGGGNGQGSSSGSKWLPYSPWRNGSR
jgi:hypothetical protein